MTFKEQETGKMHHLHLSPEQQAELKRDSLGEKMAVLINDLPPEGVTLAEIRDIVGQDGLLILTAFLTIVFMIPVSIPGVSTVFGAGIFLVGVCRLFGRCLWLPRRIGNRVLPADKLKVSLTRGIVWLHRLERLSRPHRMSGLASPGLMDLVNNLALIFGALLLMAPFGLIPFSNTLPALALLFLAVGLLQRDGYCIMLGHLFNAATVIYFAVLVAILGVAAFEVFHKIFG